VTWVDVQRIVRPEIVWCLLDARQRMPNWQVLACCAWLMLGGGIVCSHNTSDRMNCATSTSYNESKKNITTTVLLGAANHMCFYRKSEQKFAALWRESIFCSVCVSQVVNKSPRRCGGNLILSSGFWVLALEKLKKRQRMTPKRSSWASNKKWTQSQIFPNALGFGGFCGCCVLRQEDKSPRRCGGKPILGRAFGLLRVRN